MTTITVSRGSRSVTLELYETAGSQHITRDVGKPESSLFRTGGGAPTFSDNRAAQTTYTLVGQLVGSGAYADARVLAEDIVRPATGGTAATLDLSNVSGLSSETVEFIGDAPLTLGYPPNQGEWVSVQMQATKVTETIGSASQGDTGSGGSGSGPVEIRGNGETVEVKENLDMERSVGRPDSTTRHVTQSVPYAVDKPRSFSDEFELSALWTTSAASKQSTLVESIIRPQLGFDGLTLDFNGVYGLGEYAVAPTGSRGVRVSWSAGEAGMVRMDNLQLQVITPR